MRKQKLKMNKKTSTNWKKFLIKESGFNRIIDILSGGVPSIDSVAFLTAGNPMGEPLPLKVNKGLNLELAQWLRDRGLGFIRIRGSFGGPEKSFIVNNITKDETIAAACTFGLPEQKSQPAHCQDWHWSVSRLLGS